MQYQPKPISRKNKVIHNQTWYNDKTPNFQLYVKKNYNQKRIHALQIRLIKVITR